MRQRILRDPAQQKTAKQIYDQRAGGETGTGALLHEALQSIACQRSQSAKHNQQRIAQFLLPLRAAPFNKKLLAPAAARSHQSECGRFRRTPSPSNFLCILAFFRRRASTLFARRSFVIARRGCRLTRGAACRYRRCMPSSYLIFDFGEDEEAVQQARHKVESWKQGFRLGDKLAIKFEREHPDEEASESEEEDAEGDAEGSSAKKGSSKSPAKPAPGKHASSAKDYAAETKYSAKKKSSAKSSESSAADDDQNAGGKVRLIVRLSFSDHEKLSLQRWLDRIPTEAPFKSLQPKIVRHSDPDFRDTDQLFETLG